MSPGLINTQIWQDYLAATPDPAATMSYWNSNIPIERVIEPQEIGEMVAFLLSDRTLAITSANRLVSKEPFARAAMDG